MSNLLLPSFPNLGSLGGGFPLTRTPNFGTRIQRSVSGRVLRTRDYNNPVWTWVLTYAVLHSTPWCTFSAPNPTELATFLAFFNARAGSFDSFLLDDPNDDGVTGQFLGQGNGVTEQYQLVRTLGTEGSLESITSPNQVNAVYFNGVLVPSTMYSVSSSGLLTFTNPPPPSANITVDFSYYWRVYFPDHIDFENFAHGYWTIKTVKLTQVVAGL